MATRNTNIVAPKLIKPTVGKHVDEWGYLLNENFDKLSEFHTKVIADSEMQNQELARLENEKLNIEDIPSKVEPVVQEFLETTIKPEIDDYIDTVSKPDITKHVETKKQEINTYVNTTSKPALDSYEKEKELNTYTTTKKGELDSHTIAKKGELDAYEKTKETQLNNYTGTKQTQLDSYTNTKKGELDTYTTGKERELDTHTAEKKSELDVYEKTKEGELNTFTGTKKTEITNHTNTKKGELDTYTTQKKGEITTHTDSEIERINADSELAKKQNITDSRLQTESKEIVGAINESLWKIVAKQINNNDDLNNYKTSGMFMSKSSNFNILNKPKDFRGDGALFLSVFALAPSIVKQVIYNYVNNQTFERRWNTDNWSEWAEILNNDSKLFLGTSGISSVTYIQDSGTKTQGQGYIDKSTGQVYLCLETNTDTTITNKFMSITNVELGKKVKSGFWKLNPKQIGNNSTVTDLNTIYERGFYISTSDVNKFINVPESYMGAFELTVSSITDAISYTTQLIKDIRNNNYYVRTQTAGIGNPVSWTKWTKLLLDTDIVDNLTTADKSKVLSANMGVELNINKSDRRNRISDDISDKSKYVKLGTIGINIGNGRNLFSCIMIGGDDFGERNSYKISLQVSGRGSTQNNVYIDAIDAINLSGISRSINGYVIAKPISSNQMEIWYRGEIYSRGFSLEAIYNNGFTINNQMSWIDDDEGTIVETGVYKIFKIKQVMHENNKLFLGNSGISSIIYIQDTGEKTAGNGYVDKTTGSLYLCKVTTTDTSVTDKFLLATNIENRDRISIIEEKLGIYHPVGKISTISVSRDENSSSPTLSFSSL